MIFTDALFMIFSQLLMFLFDWVRHTLGIVH